MSDDYLRPARIVDRFGRLYPKAWRFFDMFRANRKGLGGWPDWCFLPLAAAYAVVSEGQNLRMGDKIEHVGVLGALAAWRATQGIYRFDQTVLDALWETPVTGDIPTEVLFHMPEWCVYVSTPGKTWHGVTLHGFFSHLEHDANDRRTELRLVLDVGGRDGDDLVVMPVHVGHGGVAQGLAAMLKESARHLPVPFDAPSDSIERLTSDVSPLVSLLLYLCSQAAEIETAGDGQKRPRRPDAVKKRKGVRALPRGRLNLWEVGYRLGAALRAGMSEQTAMTDRSGSHARPRPHIRRAHWHSYWVGRKQRPETRSVVLKWLPPIPINVEEVDDLTTTVRQVASD